MICDVVICHSIASTKLKTKNGNWSISGFELISAEEKKQKKYADIARAAGATVVGLAFSVYGGLGTGTIGLYNKLCLLSQQEFGVSPAQFATSLFDSTAIALAGRYGAIVAGGQLRQQRATYQMMLSRPRAGIRTRRRRQTE